MINRGDEAPDFELPNQDGEAVRLSALRGRPVVVYFYPKADTSGSKTMLGLASNVARGRSRS